MREARKGVMRCRLVKEAWLQRSEAGRRFLVYAREARVTDISQAKMRAGTVFLRSGCDNTEAGLDDFCDMQFKRSLIRF